MNNPCFKNHTRKSLNKAFAPNGFRNSMNGVMANHIWSPDTNYNIINYIITLLHKYSFVIGPWPVVWSWWEEHFGEWQMTLQWCHDERDGVSNHRRLDCLLNRFFFRRKSMKISEFCVTSLCEGNSPVTGEFPAKRASNAENTIDWVSNTRLMQTRFRTSVLITSLYCCHDCTLACKTMPPANCMIHWHISLKGRMYIITVLGF